MKKIFILLFIILITSCVRQDFTLNSQSLNMPKIGLNIVNEKVFVILPQRDLVNDDIDKYYKELKNKYENFDSIVLIWANHITNDSDTSFPKNSKYCYKEQKLECIDWRKLNLFGSGNVIPIFVTKDNYIEVKEHSLWNNFQFINKYFTKSDVYWIVLKVSTNESDNLNKLKEKIESYNFVWKTLFIASVDFSNHVNEKVAVFHDLNTLKYLNWNFSSKLEVDCPNCLYLIKNLSKDSNKTFFDLFDRTSADTKLKINSNFGNTSHIYWEFTNTWITQNEKAFSGSFQYSKFEMIGTWSENNNEVSWIFFWDTHFTRRFSDTRNPYANQENYLKCFYSNKNTNKNQNFSHNKLFYSFDFVWVNLETSVWEKSECQDSSKSIIFRTEPKYLDNFKEIWINLFWISNNHSYDCWKIWFESTKKYLREKWLNFYWDGRWTEENIFKTTVNWTKIAFFWFNDTNQPIDEEISNNKIKLLKKEWYLVIVNIHWWYEYHLTSNERQKKLAKWFIDNWANLIIWHHPHVVQEYEIYKWVPIFYSLWNFIFDQPFKDTLLWYWVVFSINNSGIKYNILEFKRDNKSYMIDCDSLR